MYSLSRVGPVRAGGVGLPRPGLRTARTDFKSERAKLIAAVGSLSSDAGSGRDIMYFACFFALGVLAPNDDDRTSGSVGSSMLQHTVSQHDETRHQKPAQR